MNEASEYFYREYGNLVEQQPLASTLFFDLVSQVLDIEIDRASFFKTVKA
jgi:hypothetical protein